MNDGKTLVEELKWIRRELNNLKAARPVSSRAVQPGAANSRASSAGIITKSAEISVPGDIKDSAFTIEITPVTNDDDSEKSDAKIQVTVKGASDFSLNIASSDD